MAANFRFKKFKGWIKRLKRNCEACLFFFFISFTALHIVNNFNRDEFLRERKCFPSRRRVVCSPRSSGQGDESFDFVWFELYRLLTGCFTLTCPALIWAFTTWRSFSSAMISSKNLQINAWWTPSAFSGIRSGNPSTSFVRWELSKACLYTFHISGGNLAEQHVVIVRSGARGCRCSLRMNKIQVLGHQRFRLSHQKRQQAFFPFRSQLDIYALDFKDTGRICKGTFF